MKGAKIISLSLVLLVCTFLRTTPAPAIAAELKTFPVGAFLAMTGSQSYYGRVMSHGLLTAIDEINAAGGVQGYKLNLIITDFKDISVDLAVSGVRKMISIDKTPFIFGSFSGCILGAQPIAADDHVIILNGGGASPALANKPYLYNNRMHHGLIMPYGLQYMWDKGYRKLAILSYQDPSGTMTRDDVVIPFWTKKGGQIVASEMNESTTVDFSAQAARIKAGKPDLIVLLQAGETSGYAVKGLREMGLKCPILATEWQDAATKAAGVEMSNDIYTVADFFDINDPLPLTQRFVKKYELQWGEKPDFFAANYYDGVYFLAELIKRVIAKGGNPLDGAQLDSAIWENPLFDSVFGGKMKFMKDGTVRKNAVLFQVTNGKSTIIGRLKPE